MAVLSNCDLEKILADNSGILIFNKREKSITGLGYDLTIGFIRDADTGEEPSFFIDEDDFPRYTLLPGHRYLVISKEFLYLSSQYMATLHSRGSYALKGIIVTSTTVDPNYAGCIACSLFNCTSHNIYIKKENQFATMVFYDLRTPTSKDLQSNDRGMPMDTLETLHKKYSNVNSDTCIAAEKYCKHTWNSVENEFSEALNRISPKIGEKLMQITFLIGNGFDLNIGLKTRYTDFYDFYIKECPEDLLAKAISSNLEKWSDLESSLGDYTSKISPEELEQFLESENNLECMLASYLKKQKKLVDFDDRDLIERKMILTLRNFYSCSHGDSTECIRKEIEDTPAFLKKYTFVNFNYTDVLDQCLDIVSVRSPDIQISPHEGKKVLHIHGLIYERNIVLGVNDENQIPNESLRKSNETFSLIKRDINNLIHKNNKIEEMHNIIKRSNIICIFGMSFGKTDQMWWQSIATWLEQDSTRKLILYSREMDSSENIKRDKSNREKILNCFFENGDILKATRKTIDKQIYVVGTKGIFDFKLVKYPKKEQVY